MRTYSFLFLAALMFVAAPARAQTTYADNFSTPHNYLSNGIAGTMWDGIYLGAGEIANPMGIWMGPGSVSVADAGISSNGTLTIQSLQTDWENDSDDGFFLYKIITNDFEMSVQVVGPIDTRAHNFPGLMVRAFGPNGAPSTDGRENYFILGRFDEYSIANMLKNETNGRKRDTKLGTWPNANHWLRIQRAGDVFNLSEKGSETEPWSQVGSVTRTDFNGQPLQVGIEHAVYDGGHTLKGAYKNFSLTVSNAGPFAKAPEPATEIRSVAGVKGERILSWTPGKGSSGSVVTIWTGRTIVKHAPANGMTYKGNPAIGMGDPMPGINCYVVYAGPESKVTITGLKAEEYHIAVFSYVGAGKSISYSHTPATCDIAVE
jgi:hypothetical protein